MAALSLGHLCKRKNASPPFAFSPSRTLAQAPTSARGQLQSGLTFKVKEDPENASKGLENTQDVAMRLCVVCLILNKSRLAQAKSAFFKKKEKKRSSKKNHENKTSLSRLPMSKQASLRIIGRAKQFSPGFTGTTTTQVGWPHLQKQKKRERTPCLWVEEGSFPCWLLSRLFRRKAKVRQQKGRQLIYLARSFCRISAGLGTIAVRVKKGGSQTVSPQKSEIHLPRSRSGGILHGI